MLKTAILRKSLLFGVGLIVPTVITLSSLPANAGIFAVGDSGSWISPGTNTIANLGFNIQSVPDSGLGGFQPVSSLPLPISGTLSFSPTVQSAFVGSDWATWSNGYTGEVYYSGGATTLALNLSGTPTTAFDFYAEPDPFAVINITATAQDGTSLTQAVNGFAGAQYFGFYTDAGSIISSITVSSPSAFAVGQLRAAQQQAVPEPSAVLSLLALGGLGLVSLKRKVS